MRRLGAVAGLVPAAMALSLVALFGSAASVVSFAIASALIVVIAVAIGWLVAPLIGGSVLDDVAAACAYVIVACLFYLLIGTIGSVWVDVRDGVLDGPLDIVVAIGFRSVYGVLYVPLFAIVAVPFAVVWTLAVRFLRRRIVGPANGDPVLSETGAPTP